MSKQINDPIIEFRNVSKKFKSGNEYLSIFNGINLTIFPGDFVVIKGPSGSGKSTFLNMISGLELPDQGEIFVNSEDITKMSDNKISKIRQDELGLIFQFFNLHDGLTALENIELPLLFKKKSNNLNNAIKLLEKVNLSHRKDHFPHELSGGERQRIAIARALINGANILLADEPTGNLDHETGKEILDLLVELNENEKVTIIMVTHDLSLIRDSFHVINIENGLNN